MTSASTEAEARLAAVIAGVVRTAARDAGRDRLVLVDDGSPEADLVERLLADGSQPSLERAGRSVDDPEARRHAARTHAGPDGLLLHPANKTVAVLWPDGLAEPVLPLADLYATQVHALAGGWSAPPSARAAIDAAGGIEAVDRFLTLLLDERRDVRTAAAHLDPGAADRLIDRYRAGWWWRRRLGVVPKVGPRTLGIDLR